jgi:hypothetical protein
MPHGGRRRHYGGFGGVLVGGTTPDGHRRVPRPKLAYEVAVAVTNTTPMGVPQRAGRRPWRTSSG